MLTKLWVKGFRNLKESVFHFNEKEHLFILGENNQGKTNFLESLYLLGHGTSPITSKPEHVVSFQNEAAYIGGDIVQGETGDRIYIKVSNNGSRDITINNKRVRTYTSLKKYLNIDYLSADILHIFTTTAEFRRRDLDRFCMAIYPEYKAILQSYERIVKQKNKALKQEISQDELRVWNQQLVAQASQVIEKRKEALLLIQEDLKEIALAFSSLPIETLTLSYLFKSLEIDIFEKHKYETLLTQKLEENMDKEAIIGYSMYGPHRDDYDVVLGGHSLFNFYSRGINRTLSILLKVSQLRLIEKQYGTFPVLLLDDTFAELDRKRKETLMSILKDHTQIIYTTVLEEDKILFSGGKQYAIKDGVLEHGVLEYG